MNKPKGKKRQPFAAIVADLGSKQPVIGTEPSPQKIPVAAVPPSSNAEAPAWRIGRLEFVDPYGWHVVDVAKLNEIRIKLSQYEAKTWNDILVREKHWNHTVRAIDLGKDARSRLAAIHLDDVEELVSLRLTGPERVWGYRIGFVLHILWWDPKHQVCPSPKKHT